MNYTKNKPQVCNRPLEFTEAISTILSHLSCFKGRARRSEYWWGYLALTIASYVFYFILVLTMGLSATEQSLLKSLDSIAMPTVLVSGGWFIATIYISLNITIRRLHDTNHSGWWAGAPYILVLLMIVFALFADAINLQDQGNGGSFVIGAMVSLLAIALIGVSIYVLVLTLKDSDPAANKYGPSQKYALEQGAENAEKESDAAPIAGE